jgi:hypothetical protein
LAISHHGPLPVALHPVSWPAQRCVERSATQLFHAGHDRQRNIHAGSTQRMLNAYNAKLRRYLIDNHYMETLAFHTIPGSTIIDRFGFRECPRR